MDPVTGGLLMGGMSLLGNLFGQNSTNQMQQQMMQQQQAYQTQMSNTAYQRASTDMTAAGLNPMMMFSSGSAASTPAGAAPSSQVKSGVDMDGMNKAISTAVQAKVASATIDNLVEQNAKIKAEAATERTRPALVVAQTGTEREKPEAVRADVANTDADTRNKGILKYVIGNEAERAINERELRSTPSGRLLDQAGMAGRKVSEIISPVTNLVSSARGVKSLFTDRYGHW